jgi:Flp pilus assembly protein TadG
MALPRTSSVTRLRRKAPGERGATIVEFAIIAPLLFALVFGIIDFGWAFMQDLSVKQAAREGGRIAIVDGETTAGCAGLISDIKQRVSSDLKTSSMTASLSVTDSNGDGIVGDVGDVMTITVTYPLSSLSGFTTALIGGTMTSTIQMRMEQKTNWGTSCSG